MKNPAICLFGRSYARSARSTSFFRTFLLIIVSFLTYAASWAQPYRAATWVQYTTSTQTFPMAGTPQTSYVTAASHNYSGALTKSSDGRCIWINSNTAATVNTSTAPYLSYSITTNATMTFDRFVFTGLAVTGTACKVQLRWSVDGFATSLGDFTINGSSYTLTSVNLASKGAIAAGAIEFRAYYYASGGTSNVYHVYGTYSALDGTPSTYTTNSYNATIWYSTVACGGTPTAGTAALSSSTGNYGSSANLSLTGYSTGVSGITIQWQESATAGGPFSDIASATAATYATNPVTQATTYYRAKVTCSNSGMIAYSNEVTYTASALAGSGTALTLNGTNQYVELAGTSSINTSNMRTMECWVKFNSLAGDQEIISKSTGGAGLEMLLYSGNLAFYAMKDGSNYSYILYPTSNLATGIWYHVAAAWDGTKEAMTLYVNGKAVGTKTNAGNVNTGIADPGTVRIGNWNGAARYLSASVDEVRIWNVNRSAADIKKSMYFKVDPGTAGLMAYYNMNESAGTTIVNLSTSAAKATNSNGTLLNTITRTSSPVQYSNSAIVFDGTDDVININNPLSAGASYTKEAWVYMTKAVANPQNVVSSNNSPFWIGSNTLRAGNNGSTGEVIDPATFVLNTWTHVAVTFNAATGALRLYKNGNLVASATTARAYVNETNYIGAWYNTGTLTNEAWFGGTIDEVRVWNVVRTQTEIQSKMNTFLLGNEAGLVSYYTFNQGVAAGDNSGLRFAIDETTNNNHGLLNNFTLNTGASNWITSTNGASILPVRITSFTAYATNNSSVALNWTTGSEQNSLHFEIERSKEGIVFEKIGTVAAAGNSEVTKSYQFTDLAPGTGTNFYRLKQVDIDGVAKYSSVQKVTTGSEALRYTILQNPVGSELKLSVQSPTAQTLKLEVRDARGALLVQRVHQLAAGSSQYTLPVGNLAKGTYFLSVHGDKETKVRTFVKQ